MLKQEKEVESIRTMWLSYVAGAVTEGSFLKWIAR